MHIAWLDLGLCRNTEPPPPLSGFPVESTPKSAPQAQTNARRPIPGLRIRLPDWVRAQNLDPTIYPLLPSIRQARRSVANLEKFLSTGIGEQPLCLHFLDMLSTGHRMDFLDMLSNDRRV